MYMKILGAILGIMVLIAAAVWASGFDDYMDCLNDDKKDNDECFIEFFMKSPPAKEVKEIEEACDEADLECLAKLGEKKVLDDIRAEASN